MSPSESICGISCSLCPIYRLSHGDPDAPDHDFIIRQWSELLGTDIRKYELACDGCDSEKRFEHCISCAIRSCGIDRGISGCSSCVDQVHCAMYNGFTEWFTANKDAFLFG